VDPRHKKEKLAESFKKNKGSYFFIIFFHVPNLLIVYIYHRIAQTGYGLGGRGLIAAGARFFSFFLASRAVLGPTQPPIQWVPRVLSPWESGQGMKLTTHLHLVLRSRMMELYLHSPICVHGMVLNLLSTRTPLP
jgi:hypothetical protein